MQLPSVSKGRPLGIASRGTAPTAREDQLACGSLSSRTARQFSVTFFVPSAARGVFGLDAVGAGLIISTGYLCAIVVNLAVGALMDRYTSWSRRFASRPAGLIAIAGRDLTKDINNATLIDTVAQIAFEPLWPWSLGRGHHFRASGGHSRA